MFVGAEAETAQGAVDLTVTQKDRCAQLPAEKDKIALYLNFDMIGSSNHVFFVYDGDNSDGVGAGPGPDGSMGIEKTFEAFYNKKSVPFKGIDFDGRSDYGPFIAAGIPAEPGRNRGRCRTEVEGISRAVFRLGTSHAVTAAARP